MTDAELVTAKFAEVHGAEAPAGRPALEQVYAEHSRAVYNYLCFQTGDPSIADELLAVVFEKVLVGLRLYDAHRGPLKPWLYTIVRNCVRNYRRAERGARARRGPGFERLVSSAAGPEELAVARDDQRELVAAVSRLGRRDREVIGLKFTGGLSNESIARVLGVRTSHVAVILHRAIQRLRTDLQEGDRS